MILFGKPVAEKIYQSLKIKDRPSMAVVLVGEDPASLAYVRVKEKKAEKLGINFRLFHFSGACLQKQVLDLISELNDDQEVSGIIIQLPLPTSFETDLILQAIVPQKDIDGFSGKYPAPTAAAILEILKYYQIDYHQKKMVIIGRGRLVGRPLAKILMAQALEPLMADSNTENLKEKTLSAEIIISAAGVPGLIKADMISEKAIVVDAGTAESGGKIAGDVDPAIYRKVQSYTPTPGGVGPVTVACLMRNLVKAANK